jgi:hypothetical protein
MKRFVGYGVLATALFVLFVSAADKMTTASVLRTAMQMDNSYFVRAGSGFFFLLLALLYIMVLVIDMMTQGDVIARVGLKTLIVAGGFIVLLGLYINFGSYALFRDYIEISPISFRVLYYDYSQLFPLLG